MWGSRNRRSGSSSLSYDDDYSSSYSSDDKDIFDYKNEVESACGVNFYCDGDVQLDYVSAYVAGDKIVVTFNLIVYPGAQQWQINRAVENAVRAAANETGCPYSISYSAHVSEYR